MIDFTTITSCGECCIGCTKKENGICPGCIETEGKVPEWAGSGVCKICACCKEHNVRFCGLCEEFPCEKLPQMISWNPNIINHLSELRDEYQNQMMRSDVRNTTLIEKVLRNWELIDPKIGEQFNEESARLIFKIKTDSRDYLLKGIPCGIPESTIKSNVRAHLFLGNENGMAPKLYKTKTGEDYIGVQGYWFYLMEFIDGREMEETSDDEYKLGQAARKMHNLSGYDVKSPLTQSKERFYTWFRKHDFVKEFDAILDAIPDFEMLDQCFVHTDVAPHNAMLRQDGEVAFIDLDDAGIGSRYLDLGWSFVMQFVDFNHDTEEMTYRFDLALSFLKGYFGEDKISRKEYDLLFYGAIQMHISYMQVYGPYAVDSLWKILLFGIEQKEVLWEMLQKEKK